MKKILKSSYLAIILMLIYIPLAAVIVISFTNAEDGTAIGNMATGANYSDLFQQIGFINSLLTTLLVALVSTTVAVIIGTLAAIGLSRAKKVTRSMTLTVTHVPLINADVVTAVSLMLSFLALNFNFGLPTLILAHISFNIPYVIITILPQMRKVKPELIEASLDLGATPFYTLRKIIIPTLMPAILTGAAIAFAMSFDDFIISYFTGGESQNLSTFIYTLKTTHTYINALGTILLAIIAALIIGWNIYKYVNTARKQTLSALQNETYKSSQREQIILFQINSLLNPARHRWQQYYYHMYQRYNNRQLKAFAIRQTRFLAEQAKRLSREEQRAYYRRVSSRSYRLFQRLPWRSLTGILVLAAAFAVIGATYSHFNTYDLLIANWDEYMPTKYLQEFESENHAHVLYTKFPSNEALYQKLFTTNYDLMVPSDYMAKQLAQENRLEDLSAFYQKYAKNNDIDEILEKAMTDYSWKTSSGIDKNLTDYMAPYFWGDIILVFNLTDYPDLLTALDIKTKAVGDQTFIDSTVLGWDVLSRAVKANYKILMSNDMRNTLLVGLQATKGQTNAKTITDVNSGFDYLQSELKNKAKSNKIIWMDDGDMTQARSNFAVGVFYPGTTLKAILGTNLQSNTTVQRKYKVAIPQQITTLPSSSTAPTAGTNLWVDGMVINKNAKHKELAYKFIQFIYDHQSDLSRDTFYTSPLTTVINDLTKSGAVFEPYKDIYEPLYDPIKKTRYDLDGTRTTFYQNNFTEVINKRFQELLA